ncbi:hypothetical protein FDP41_009868 [Naegleria fowleri]|uniref:EF-hand domain-containing protein n=1 Tax=Naegleria fowleri TaxID=5763 RepID=A0A6A5BBZ4_NAEFO|nr:uncharacterized protein FDP41_009868 [Naegleria fowleri]KAF0971645.1 hypothetical protein FDP41_009868 [Naegleria fowleri]CAG4719358.1 unnamed protein product [Naegleria fowleri]
MYETPTVWVPDGIIASRDVFNNINVIKEQASTVFTNFDKDKDGLLNKKEFKYALKSFGIRKKQAKAIRKLWDIEKTGFINSESFLRVYCFIRSGQLYTRKLDKYEELENTKPLVMI